MNPKKYEANTTKWKKGDFVIHHFDAKEPKMLMVVVGYTRDGLCKTQYILKTRSRRIMNNDIQWLHNPERFGIQAFWGNYRQEALEKIQIEWERVRRFNRLYPLNQMVRTTSADGEFIATTKGAAYLDKGGDAWVYLSQGGNWLLKFIEPVEELELQEVVD